MDEERRIPGACRCGERITKIENSTHPTSRRDGARFIYTDRKDEGWCIFRCDSCIEVIEDSWSPLAAPAAGPAEVARV